MTQVVQLKITLKGSKPVIWRRILVSEETTMNGLHHALNAVMGWTDSHLHDFDVQGSRITDTEIDGFDDYEESAISDRKIKLKEVLRRASAFDYTYDFGDGWIHRVEVEDTASADASQKYPVCTAGKNACPPEDCGGLWGYEEFKQIMADPKHPEHEERQEWYGGHFDPIAFDPEDFNSRFPRRRVIAKK